MSLLQRPPIRGEAVYGCEGATRALYRTAHTILLAGQTRRPYAGAIVHGALTKPERFAILEAGPGGEAAQKPPFLHPINLAIAAARPHISTNPRVDFMDMKLSALTEDNKASWHFDQTIRSDGLPHYGPITAIAVLKGSMKYWLSVSRKDVFDPASLDYFDYDKRYSRLTRHVDELTATTGDVLLFTNIPATYHAAEVVEPSVRGIYFSHLARNPVE